MEMLMSTDANIVAFEPNPPNHKLLSYILSLLDPKYQGRVALFPIALGSESVKSQIYSSKENMGNSVVGKPIKDDDGQHIMDPVYMYIERFDSIFSDQTHIPLVKLDVQGFECQVLDGMSQGVVNNIQQVKFENEKIFLEAHGCVDLVSRFQSLGFTLKKCDHCINSIAIKKSE
jgi:FkbM family methyltransferase